MAEKYIRRKFGGKLPIGDLYIDRWDLDGEFYRGGCFLYFEGETLRDYCYKNSEPYPVLRALDEVIDVFETKDFSNLKKSQERVSVLKNIHY